MAPMWIQGIFAVTLLFSRSCFASSEGSWCYNGPHCGPATWQSLGQCHGKRQSPIDIIPSKAVRNPSLGAVTLVGYDESKQLLEMKNTGKTVDVHLGDGLRLTGHGLPATYTAKAFHLHWGDGVSNPGSEHSIDGKRYSMELHIVHTRNNMSVSDALRDPEGIAVLGFFVQGSEKAQDKTAEAWESFVKNLPKVSKKDKDTKLDSKVSLREMLGSVDLTRYYRYSGSLTTPNCNEIVIWTVFTDPILVPSKVVDSFPSELYSTDVSNGPHLENNFRPVQKTGDRKVEESASLMSNAPIISTGLRPLAILFLLFVSRLTFLVPV